MREAPRTSIEKSPKKLPRYHTKEKHQVIYKKYNYYSSLHPLEMSDNKSEYLIEAASYLIDQ